MAGPEVSEPFKPPISTTVGADSVWVGAQTAWGHAARDGLANNAAIVRSLAVTLSIVNQPKKRCRSRRLCDRLEELKDI